MTRANEAPPKLAHMQDLDPTDWTGFRAQAHKMLDDILDHTAGLRDQPVWQPMPTQVRSNFSASAPLEPTDLTAVHREFKDFILPYSVGNLHPRFLGWVHGAGTVEGMLAEMLSGGLNANVGGRDHAAVEVERQVTRWMASLMGLPTEASGVFVTGASMGNMIAVLAARRETLGESVRSNGIAAARGAGLTAYAARSAHNCIVRAMDFCGLGTDALRLIDVDAAHRMDVAAARAAIARDRAAGHTPFLLIGTAGTVDTGAIDDLGALAELAKQEGLWFHVDGAFGALGMMSPRLAPKFAGIEHADSIACDFHKWGQVPYDAGFVLVRDPIKHMAAFTSPAAYLARETRGLAGGSPWPCDFGPDLSRGFRALKVWFTLKVHGVAALGATMAQTCDLAAAMADRIDREPELERLAPVELNIVCFRFRADDMDATNAQIVISLQESGVAAPSTTRINGALAIRCAFVNHRTRLEDIDLVIDAILEIGRGLACVGADRA